MLVQILYFIYATIAAMVSIGAAISVFLLFANWVLKDFDNPKWYTYPLYWGVSVPLIPFVTVSVGYWFVQLGDVLFA